MANLFTQTDSNQQTKMTGATNREIEQAARRNFEQADCNFSALIQSTGACNTESTWLCKCNPKSILWWRGETCATKGKKVGCALLKELRKRREIAEFLMLRREQISDDYIKSCDGNTCQFIPRLTPHAPDKSGDSVAQAEPVKSSNPPVESAPL